MTATLDTQALKKLDQAHHLHPFTDFEDYAKHGGRIVSRAEHIYIYDSDGNKIQDGMSGLWCCNLGYSQERIKQAVADQLAELPFYNNFFKCSNQPAVELAARLSQVTPDRFQHVFFTNSGSEANDTAMKMVWYYQAARGKPEKRKIISRRRGYHGVTMAAASMTALAYAQNGFGLPLDFVKHTTTPDYYNEGRDGESEAEFTARCAAELEALIIEEGPETVGALFAEPVMGAGGVIIPPAGYFAAIREVLARHDVLLVADEVICGFGRTGEMWGSQTMDVRPDMLTCAKALSSAYLPISAVLMSDRVYDTLAGQAEALGIFGHGYTYSAHPVCAAVALRAQQLMQERDIIGNVKRLAPRFAERVSRMDRLPFIGNTRSVGMIGAMEFSSDPDSKAKFDPAHKIAARAVAVIQEHGVILRALPGDIIGFCPPLVINGDELDDMFDRVEAALDEFTATAEGLR